MRLLALSLLVGKPPDNVCMAREDGSVASLHGFLRNSLSALIITPANTQYERWVYRTHPY